MDRLTQHAARRGMTLQEYVARTLVREDFDERFHDAVERTERLDGRGSTGRVGQDA
nr:ribbon-helix-helix protein, CopG family [Streptomyces sp. SM12]